MNDQRFAQLVYREEPFGCIRLASVPAFVLLLHTIRSYILDMFHCSICLESEQNTMMIAGI